METINKIIDCLKWLEEEGRGNNIVSISRKLDEISLLSVTIGSMVNSAYKAVSEAEDDYDIEFATRFTELTKQKISAAAAKPQVEAELGNKKREWTLAKYNYKKLDTFLTRIDRVIETHRQSISVMKLELKNL